MLQQLRDQKPFSPYEHHIPEKELDSINSFLPVPQSQSQQPPQRKTGPQLQHEVKDTQLLNMGDGYFMDSATGLVMQDTNFKQTGGNFPIPMQP